MQDSYSLPRRATCGVPEGDPLSVVAAVMIGAQLHWAITRDVPAQPLIYIDNIEIIAQDETDIHMATDIALDFFRQWGFKVDQNKSWSWSTKPARLLERQPHFSNQTSAVNLGCAMNYKKSNKHGEFKHRLIEGTRRAKIIASLPLPQVARMEAVKGGPFAAAFYGSEVHYVGEKSIAQLRREVASIVAKPHRGLCPKVALLAYGCGLWDPKLVLILRACRMARRAVGKFPSRFKHFWNLVKTGAEDTNATYGPARVLGAYLNSINITIHENGNITSPVGKELDFFRSCPTELEQCITHAWEHGVTKHLRQRQGLETLGDLDLHATCRALNSIAETDARLVRTYLAGGIPTNLRVAHWQDVSINCPQCKQPDTLAHRLRTCIATEKIRSENPLLAQLASSHATSAWALKPEVRLPIPADTFEIPALLRDDEDLIFAYTDGSAYASCHPHLACAGFAVVLDPIKGEESRRVTHAIRSSPTTHFEVCIAGRVPNRQTVPRAELFAIAHALLLAKNLVIVSDCQ